MIFVKDEAKATTAKIEGTTQTYGQLISVSSRSDISTARTANLGQSTATSPRDTVVKIIPNTISETTSQTSQISDLDRSRISQAAFSDTKDPSVAINQRDDDRIQSNTQSPNTTQIRENNLDYALVVGSNIKTRDEIKRVLTDAKKVDMMITLKSKESEIIEFNNLKEIEPQASFTYNFFENTEEDTESQENQALDPLLTKSILNVPRYVKLSWNSIKTTEVIQDPVQTRSDVSINKKNKDELFARKKGVLGYDSSNFKKSFDKSKKQTALLNHEGTEIEVNDIHNLDNAMNSTSNKQVFANTINAVFNLNDSRNVIKNIPILIKK